MSAYQRFINALRNYGSTVKEAGTGKAMAQCPAHDDRNPSLSIGPRSDGKGVVVKCFAECDTADVMAALGLTMADLFDDAAMRDVWNPIRTYTYRDGRTVQRRPDGNGGKEFWQQNAAGCNALYRAERVDDAPLVFVCEGEKDVEAVEAVGSVAVCSAMGAGSAGRADWSPLKGKTVVVIADRDEAGEGYAATVVQKLDGVATSVSVVRAAVGKDVAEHLAAGLSLGELVQADFSRTDDGQDEHVTDGRPRLWSATDLKPSAQPRWLAKNRMPFAAVSLLVGDEGIGKSLLWVWIVAAVTTGKPLPGFGIPARDPSRVILVVTEDGWRDTVLPRLQVAGADLGMVEVICTEDDGSGAPEFPRDLHLIDEARPALVVVDTWLDTVPSKLSVKDPQQARQALHPWKETATKTDAAVLLICHTNRVSTPDARGRYGVTSELRKKARMTLYAQMGEDDNLLVGPEKANGARTVAASEFTITSVGYWAATDEHDGTVPLLTYLGESEQTAREHLADSVADRDEGGDAVGWLNAFLADGPRWSREVHDAREAADISLNKLNVAKRKLGVRSARGASEGPWFMALPLHSGRQPGGQAPVQTPADGPVSLPQNSGSLGWSDGTSGNSELQNSRILGNQTPEITSTSQDTLNSNGGTRGRRGKSGRVPIIKPEGSGRCPECGFHVPTQGHRDPCLNGRSRGAGGSAD